MNGSDPGPAGIAHVAPGLMRVGAAPGCLRAMVGAGYAVAIVNPVRRAGGLLHLQARGAPGGGADETSRIVRFLDEVGGVAGGPACQTVVAGGADVLGVLPRRYAETVARDRGAAILGALVRHAMHVTQTDVGGVKARQLTVDLATGQIAISPIGREAGCAPPRPAVGGEAPGLRSTTVEMGCMHIDRSPNNLVAILGSCVGIALFDPFSRIGGLAHAVMPTDVGEAGMAPQSRFADTAVGAVLGEMIRQGADPRAVLGKLFGGASVLAGGAGPLGRIADRNVESARRALACAGVRVIDEDTGGGVGRRIRVNLDDFSVHVKMLS